MELDVKTLILAVHVVVGLAFLALGSLSLLAGDLLPFVVRGGLGVMVIVLGGVLYRNRARNEEAFR